MDGARRWLTLTLRQAMLEVVVLIAVEGRQAAEPLAGAPLNLSRSTAGPLARRDAPGSDHAMVHARVRDWPTRRRAIPTYVKR